MIDGDPTVCPWCLGTGFVHTSGGELGDVIAGPALCGHDGSWRIVDAAEAGNHREAVKSLRRHAHRLALQPIAAGPPEPAEPQPELIDITAPRHPRQEDQ